MKEKIERIITGHIRRYICFLACCEREETALEAMQDDLTAREQRILGFYEGKAAAYKEIIEDLRLLMEEEKLIVDQTKK